MKSERVLRFKAIRGRRRGRRRDSWKNRPGGLNGILRPQRQGSVSRG